jgi:hypothetical protein
VGFKKERLGPRLVEAARSGARYRDAHVVLGGTGAVGGTAVLQLLSLYEEMFSIRPPGSDDVPILLATGTTADEISAFTRRLFRFAESRHGADHLPQRVHRGYLTASGVFIALERFEVSALPGLRRLGQTSREERPAVVAAFLESIGSSADDPTETVVKTLSEAVSNARPFGEFLRRYRADRLAQLGIDRFRSVTVGIPIPSLIAYHQDEMLLAAGEIPGLGADEVEQLKELFVGALRDDMGGLLPDLADTVMMAHTTGVGGMYDERVADGGHPIIRMGFSHSGLDRRVAEKARFADLLTERYASAGVKVLVTAAAIGIDEVRVREPIPLHREIRKKLFEADVEVFPGSKSAQPEGSTSARRAGRPLPARQTLHAFAPITVPFDQPPDGPAAFERGEEILPSYAIRSGENGFFTVADAESLDRVMRVSSASELGLLLATVGLLGDDRLSPWFEGNICYYHETDNARQVLDFLAQPPLMRTQLSGLEPMSLQDLGSAKHQAEMHTLALLILLQRLRTLDVDAIDPYVDPLHFDPRAFFEQHSRPLTFEEVAAWEFDHLAEDMGVLASAERSEDLLPLTVSREHGLFPRRQEALTAVLREVLRAVWTVPSLGLPILVERGGVTSVRSGYYVSPLDLLVTGTSDIDRHLRRLHQESANPCTFDEYRGYHLAVGGFVDLRPHAIVCTAKSDREDLTGRVATFTDLESLRAHIRSLEPYSFFATCGLLAVFHRLRALYGLLRESMIDLGSLHEWRWHTPRDAAGHILLVPGVVESLRMVGEGLEKTTGSERLDGVWGYERRPVPDRRGTIPGIPSGNAGGTGQNG